MHKFKSIRNVAVIAHVDHGKTTLVDAMLKQSNLFRANQAEMREERILDRNELERERGITILAKNCAIFYQDTKINIIDTPGHVDFSGEVERTLSMADGALLIVDAAEGPMPQTRSVLRQALKLGLKVIVVVNKVDKQNAEVAGTLAAVETLFLELVKNEHQLDFPVLYAEGRKGRASLTYPVSGESVEPLLQAIIGQIPESSGEAGAAFKMLVSSIEYDPHVGRIAIGKLAQGSVKKGQRIIVVGGKEFAAEHVFTFDGLKRTEAEEAGTGDIVGIAGTKGVTIGQTLGEVGEKLPYPAPVIGEPTLHMRLMANSSPLAGKEGTYVTSRQLEERLARELESNLSLRVKSTGNGSFRLSGRGELHLSVLLETMRREGYEMEVSKPEAIVKEQDGAKVEPYEHVEIVIPNEHEGVVHGECGRRYAEVVDGESLPGGEIRLVFKLPTRATLGLRSVLLTLTRGTLLYSTEFVGFAPLGKSLPKLRSGVLIASHKGAALSYGLAAAQERGETFVMPGTEVYQGMIVGRTNREEDIKMNVCKGKQLTNMRSKSSDGVIQLAPPLELSLEQALDFLESDELLEITPKSLRLRKKNLTGVESKRMS